MIRKSYIISNYKVSKTTYQSIHNRMLGFDSEQRRFFLHLLCSHMISLGREDHQELEGYDVLGLNLPYKTIKAEFKRGFSWHPLRDSGLIEASDYADGECRYFQVKPGLVHRFAQSRLMKCAAPERRG